MPDEFARAARRQAIFWAIAIVVFALFLWLFRGVLLPFVAGMALAYFLDPVADFFERMGFSRLVATILILAFFLIVFVVGLAIFLPILSTQVYALIERMPQLVGRLQELVTSTESEWLRNIIGIEGRSLQDAINEFVGQSAGWITTVLQQVWASGKAVVNVLSLAIVTPVVAFYLLYDWDRMVAKVDGWLPRDHYETITEIMADINSAIAGFVRGQGTLCLILGVFYAAGLTVLGVSFGLLIGLFAGLISFIPYVGTITGFLLSMGVALVQFWPEWWPLLGVAAVFGVGQFFEGNILQPKLVGDSVGLHPVWLMFALFAFGALFGFTGLLVAVPAAAAVGVVVRFALARYLESDLYKGHGPKPRRGRSK